MEFSFHNRFTIFDERLNIDSGTYVLSDTGDEKVTLSAGSKGTKIKETGELVLDGGRYPNESRALEVARRWRRDLTVALARSHIPAEFGPDDQTAPSLDMIAEDPAKEFVQLGIEPGDRVVLDGQRLLILPSDPKAKFVHGSMSGSVLRGLEKFESHLTSARARADQNWSEEKALAHHIVSAALRDGNPETQHIQLVTAIEVLLKAQDREPSVLAGLDQLIEGLATQPGIEVAAQKRLVDILRDARQESISRAARDQLAAVLRTQYGGKPVDAFFSRVYDMRSRLLHRKRRSRDKRPTPAELADVHFELWRMVLDFLDVSD